MSAVVQMAAAATDAGPARAQMLDAVRAVASGSLAAMVDEIDRIGTYPQSVLRELGKAGAYRA